MFLALWASTSGSRNRLAGSIVNRVVPPGRLGLIEGDDCVIDSPPLLGTSCVLPSSAISRIHLVHGPAFAELSSATCVATQSHQSSSARSRQTGLDTSNPLRTISAAPFLSASSSSLKSRSRARWKTLKSPLLICMLAISCRTSRALTYR